MKLTDLLIAYSRSVFKLNVLTFDTFDILFAVTHLRGFPKDADGELYDLENYGFIKITDNEIVFYCHGDWQPPVEITIQAVGNMPQITNYRVLDHIENEISEDMVYELLNLPKL